MQARQQRLDGQWQNGLWVLACYKCNNERAALETAWLAQTNPDGFYRRGNSKPADIELIRAQGHLAGAIYGFLLSGGQLTGNPKRIKTIMRAMRRLGIEYEKKRVERKPC